MVCNLVSLLYLYGLFHHYTCLVSFIVIPVWFVSLLYWSGLFHCYTCLVCFTVISVWFVSLLYLSGLFHCYAWIVCCADKAVAWYRTMVNQAAADVMAEVRR